MPRTHRRQAIRRLVAVVPLLVLTLACATQGRQAARERGEHVPPQESLASMARPVARGDAYGAALQKAHALFSSLDEGANADYIPALAKVDPKLFGIALATVDGRVYEVGDSKTEFSIQSISKVFTLARAIDALGKKAVEKRIGVNATGMPFNSIEAIELNKDTHPAMNPLVNAGAMGTVAILPGESAAGKWTTILGTYNSFAARPLAVNETVYKSESETNQRNGAILRLLAAYDVVEGNLDQTLDLYTRQCSINVSAHDLAVMGATLANGGRNPITGEQVVKPETVPYVLAVMATAGLYETTGQWLYEAGVPAKSGVGGGIVAVVPGRFAIGTFAPPLDKVGNSVRGQRAISSIASELGVHLFASEPTLRQVSTASPAAGLAR